jgi:hypothetical protein
MGHCILEGILARISVPVTFAGKESSERARCELVSGNYFDVLKVKSWHRCLLTSTDDERPGSHPIVVLSYGFWQRGFDGDGALWVIRCA